ncbi:hypothetical protein [Floridanema aerugineum]|uniref:Uncharacterized protein n=1 Tax=Floridaenema aerugineum BLCC-F46 TaxID=3153654 RepID=A0ABV4XBR1_9CYAN
MNSIASPTYSILFYLVMADGEKAIATAFTFSSLNFGYDCSILEKLNSSEPVNSVTLPNT